jgi:uncharacterized protein YjdB
MVEGELIINISNQMATITTNKGTYQVTAVVNPPDTTDKSLTWIISNGMDKATVNTSGLVTAVKNGTATVKATLNDGGAFGTLDVVITNQRVIGTSVVLT